MKTTRYDNTTRYYLCTAIMWIMMAGATAFGQTFYSQTVMSDTPLAYWNFDEATGNAIQQIGPPNAVNDFVPVDGATRVAHGTIGSGLLLGNTADFNGANNFNAIFPNFGASSLAGPYAVEFWMQMQTPGGSGGTKVPIGLDGGGDRALYYDESPNYLELYGGAGGRTGANGISIADTDTAWHHILYVFYGSLRATAKVDGYLDGVRLANIPGYDQSLSLAGPITIGEYRPEGGAGMTARIDEVAFYDFAAFADEASLTSYVDDLDARHLAAAVVPEPSSCALVGVGLLITLLIQRRRVQLLHKHDQRSMM